MKAQTHKCEHDLFLVCRSLDRKHNLWLGFLQGASSECSCGEQSVCVCEASGVHPERWALQLGAATSAYLSKSQDPSSRTAVGWWSWCSARTDRHPEHMQAWTTCKLVYKPPASFLPKAAVINSALRPDPSKFMQQCSASHHRRLLPHMMNSYPGVITPCTQNKCKVKE